MDGRTNEQIDPKCRKTSFLKGQTRSIQKWAKHQHLRELEEEEREKRNNILVKTL